MSNPFTPDEERSEPPIFNAPSIVTWLIGALVAVHLIMALLPANVRDEAFLLFAFFPARFSPAIDGTWYLFPGSPIANLWVWITYAFLHADIVHLGINAIWLLAFGSPVARRIGWRRFLVLYGLAAIAGAAAHLIFHWGSLLPVIGASAGVSGMMGAAIRFTFTEGPAVTLINPRLQRHRQRPASLLEVLTNRQVMTFVIIWFGINLIFGLGSIGVSGEAQLIAWQAHIGGFLVGLLLFGLFDSPREGYKA